MEAAGIEPLSKNVGNIAIAKPSGADSGAVGAPTIPIDPELAAVVNAWSILPEAIKLGIQAMIRGAK
jgi:hypothetical protein